MRSLIAALALTVALSSVASAETPTAFMGTRTLALIGDAQVRQTHSAFFAQLRAAGHKVTFRKSSDSSVVLEKYGQFKYDNVIVMDPSATSFARSLAVPELVRFGDAGGNLLVVGDTAMGRPTTDLAAEFGITFAPETTVVQDHFNSLGNGGARFATAAVAALPSVTGALASSPVPIAFEGRAQQLDADNILAFAALSAESTAFSGSTSSVLSSSTVSALGGDVTLASAVQGRNNARAVFVGSMFALSNEGFATKINGAASGNAAFASAITAWAFQQSGVLRTTSIRHRRADGAAAEHLLSRKPQPNLPTSMFSEPEIAGEADAYRIKDDLVYEVTIDQFTDGSWTGFSADDMQLEFVMLDAYVRTAMKPLGNGTFQAQFKAPDAYGIYKFRVMYRRPGFSTVHEETQVSLRPFRHNEYERFISSAYPYYFTSIVMMASSAVFIWLYLRTPLYPKASPKDQ